MILGSLSFSPSGDGSSYVERIRTVTDYHQIIFHPVLQKYFAGGYYLHPLLPYKTRDVYYYDEAKDILVLLSGSVYNKAELYQILNISKPIADPELIAKLFLHEGPGFVKRLNGDYTIFILQQDQKQALLYRDQMGIQPMAWAYDNQFLVFSSDATGLCRALSGDEAIDSEYLLSYFKFIDYRKTPNSKVGKLLPGYYLELKEGGVKMNKYWRPGKLRVDVKLKYDHLLSDLSLLLHDAVRIRCDGRFAAGAHESGGIDSGIVSALVRKQYPQQNDFYGFSWSPRKFSPGDAKYDERLLALKSAEEAGIVNLFADMSQTDFQNIVSSYYYNQGYFSEDNTSSQAGGVGVNLIFSGWGGDEFISTGKAGVDIDLLRGLKLRVFFRRNPLRPLKKFVKRQLFYVVFPALGILDKGISRSFRRDARYIRKVFSKSDKRAIRSFYFHTSRHQMHLNVLRFYNLQERCESWYMLGFRKGIEYRYPLLDKRIIEYMMKVPSGLLCKSDYFRPLLREISKGILPDEVRLNESKNDPVYWSWMGVLFKDAACTFLEEVDEWRANRDLQFIDFDLLSDDIAKYKKSHESVDCEGLFRALVYFKAIHEFTVTYRHQIYDE